MEIVLVSPQIPPNTGNVARLCAATNLRLHLIQPLGFKITNRHLKRAGLDYWKWVDLRVHQELSELLDGVEASRLHFFSKLAEKPYTEVEYHWGDLLIFGNEKKGLPATLAESYGERFRRIPIMQPRVRSLNLATAVAVVTYEALRQLGKLG